VPLCAEFQREIYEYCSNHLADNAWYKNEFNFIRDENLKERIGIEFKAIRFAYKLYEGIAAKEENYLFQVRSQILSYATIYEAIIQHVLDNYYRDTAEYEKLTTHTVPIKISIPKRKKEALVKELSHDGKDIVPFYYGVKPKEDTSIRFDDKCRTAEKLGIIRDFKDSNGVLIKLPEEIIEIYSYRNGIHLVAEQRKGITYELELSKRAYRRMRPFIDQIKERLDIDGKLVSTNIT
jgi:hypothetical protein